MHKIHKIKNSQTHIIKKNKSKGIQEKLSHIHKSEVR